jgi:D-alanyl-D-alanine carboxypeptidase/D-alanyl-D-alanine-endopeptidase (penicillin-binding protein 4)
VRRLTIIIAALLVAAPAEGGDFSRRIERVLNDPCLAGADVCMVVKSIATGKLLYSKNPDRLMVPASNMKIVTSAAALGILKPSYRFKTLILHSGERDGETLKGDLVIRGSGDPHLVSEDMWLIVNELRKRGIRRVTGNLVLDDSYFDDEKFPPTWKLSPTRRAFEAPSGALALNFNSVTINIYPAKNGKDKPHAAIDPQTSYFTLVNKMRSTSFGKNRITIDLRPGKGGGETVVLGGVVRAGSRERTYYRAVSDPIGYFGLTFLGFAKRAGITFGGKVMRGMPDEPLKELYAHTSRPLYQQLMDMNQYSSNFMAEQIVKTIGAEAAGNPGRFENGLSRIREFLVSLGFSPDRFKLADGSGLSTENRASCSLIVGLLERLYTQWDGGPEFITSLARMGREGSVEERLTSTGKVIRVKTGTLKSVSALSGYYPLDSGDILAFSMIHNNLSCGNGDVWGIQDRVLIEFEGMDAGKN